MSWVYAQSGPATADVILCTSSSHRSGGLCQPHNGVGRGWGAMDTPTTDQAQKQGRPEPGSQNGPSPVRNQLSPAKMLSANFFFFFLKQGCFSHTCS